MRYVAQTVDGKVIDLKVPTMVKMNQSMDAPADDLTIVLPIDGKYPELKDIRAYLSDELVFYGVVDIQSLQYTASGVFLTIVARSIASYLLDNEAKPQIYYSPSLKIIYERHVEPYGFKGFTGSDKSFSTKFVTSKGMSEWSVLESFCKDFLRVVPIVDRGYIINATGSITNRKLLFSNSGNNIKYNSFTENNKRYKILSDIYVRAQKDGLYSVRINNPIATAKGIVRKRYLNALDNTKQPAVCADIMIKSSDREAYEVILDCPGAVDVQIGDMAQIYDRIFGEIIGLRVKEIKYRLDSHAEITQIKLYRGEVQNVAFQTNSRK